MSRKCPPTYNPPQIRESCGPLVGPAVLASESAFASLAAGSRVEEVAAIRLSRAGFKNIVFLYFPYGMLPFTAWETSSPPW